MAYCTRADMIARYGETELTQLTDRTGEYGIIVDAVLDTAITDASADIDGYLSDGGYSVPLTSPPHVLVRHCCVLARAQLYDDLKPKEVLEDMQRSLDWLERIASGRQGLPGVSATTEPRASVAAPTRDTVFNAELWERYTP